VSLVRKPWVALLVAFASLAGCEKNNQTLFVRGAIQASKDGQSGSCVYDPSSGVFLQSARLDVALRDTYSATFTVENQMVSRQDYNRASSETNRVVVTGADVRVVDGANELDFYSTVSSGSVADPLNGLTASPVQVVSPKAAAALRDSLKPGEVRSLISYVTLTGRTLGNVDVESAEYQFVLTVCKGCLVSFPPASRNPANPANNCDNLASLSKEDANKSPCFIGQDEAIDCRLCSSTNPACRPPP
jgi:hypothetical protein